MAAVVFSGLTVQCKLKTSGIAVQKKSRVSQRQVAICGLKKNWDNMYEDLVAKGFRSVVPEEALKMTSEGFTIVDVRPDEDFAKGSIADSKNIPLYNYIDAKTPGQLIRQLAFAAQGVRGTESNPEFGPMMKSVDKIILVCDKGGTMKPSVNFPRGKNSRSLQAAWYLLQDNGKSSADVVHLEGGINEWYFQGLDMVGEFEDTSGASPMSADTPSGEFINR